MEQKNTELVKIDPAQYGLQATEASQVEAVFLPMIAKMKELESEFNEVINMPIEPSTIAKAKELRLKYVKVRTGTAEIHKSAKAYYLNGGRFVDGWKNAQAFASQEKEQVLEKIEKHFENLEKERKEKLKADRLLLIADICETPEMYPLAEMSESAFNQLLDGLKLAKQQKEEAEKRAEEERIAKEKAEKEEQERIRLENEKLKKEAEQKEKELSAERERIEKEREAERQKQAKILAEQKAEADRLAKIEAEKQAKIQAELNAKAEAERKERQRIEKELAHKKELELQAKEKAEAELKAKQLAEKKAANAPDKNKLIAFSKMISEIQLPEVKSSEAEKILFDAKTLLNKVSAFITEKSKEL